MSHVIGIDLGTTNSCVAVMDGDAPRVIPNSEGSRTTPSVVAFTESGERLVGQIAKRQATTNAANTVYAAKRLIGRKFSDPEVQRMLQTCPYEIVQADNGDAAVRVRGRMYSPPEISAMVLAKMKKTAEDFLEGEVTDAVVTVPAYFDDAQRQATKDAGRIAGLNVLRIINEPTAAALAYGLGTGREERVVVYDLGGGTFDVSLLEIREGLIEVLAVGGDTFLGGEDIDRLIVDLLASDFAAQHKLDLRKDRMALQRMRDAAERAKHELSSASETDVNLPFIYADAEGPRHLNVRLTRERLEALCEAVVQRTLAPIQAALQDASLQAGDVDQVLLVGGQTRMPRIAQVVTDLFGKAPSKGVSPDEVVALGAAVQGSVLSGATEQVLLLDVTPLSLGVETAGGVFTRIIPRNTTVPARKKQVFSTAVDNQAFVNVHVLQGERELADDNKSLAHFQLLGIPPAPRGVPQIEVSFEIDADGILHVSARDLGTGKEQSVAVQPTSGLSEERINELIAEADSHAEDDRSRRQVVDLRNQARSLIYTTERALQEYADVIGEKDRAEIEEDLAFCKREIDKEDAEAIRLAIQRLEGSSHRIAELMYAQVAPGIDEAGGGDAPDA